MCFVDDDKREVGEHIGPLGVRGEEGGVQHIRVGQEDSSTFSQPRTIRLGRIAVIRIHLAKVGVVAGDERGLMGGGRTRRGRR